MAEKISKQIQDINLGIDDEIVSLPLDLCEEAVEENQFSLVAKPINPRRQNLRAMMLSFPRLWSVGDNVRCRIIQNRMVQFIFNTEETMSSILRRGPWSFNEWMCSLHKWNPEQSDEELNFIPFWIQVRGIPIQFLTLRMVTHIGGIMGHFMETDFQADGTQNVDFVRIRLLWNISVPLRFQRIFNFGSQTAVLTFRYEKLRGFCTTCGMLSHHISECPIHSGADAINPPGDNDDGDDDDDANDTGDGSAPPGFDKQHVPGSENQLNEESPSSHEGTPSKKRKTDSSSSDPRPLTQLCEIRQVFFIEDAEEHVSKRMRRQSDVREARQWTTMANDNEASSSLGGRQSEQQQQPFREGTVGQKPPESK
ncbi:hypothetical protein Bca101_019887 [Brassica carinata]